MEIDEDYYVIEDKDSIFAGVPGRQSMLDTAMLRAMER